MRELSSLLLSLVIIMTPIISHADSNVTRTIEAAEDGYYYETIIEELPSSYTDNNFEANAAKSTKSGSKTVYYKNSANQVMWYVKVTGTFSYGNGSSSCTKSGVTAASQNNSWKIASKSASKTGNKAKASATAKQYSAGVAVGSITRSVVLSCDSSGHLN